MNARFSLVALSLAVVFSRCSCEQEVRSVRPTLTVSPSFLEFGKVKVGESPELTVTLGSHSQAAVTIESASLRDGAAPGGASAFELVGVPKTVAGPSATFTVRFRPSALQAYGARLVLVSNDPERPTIELPISGEGAQPVLEVRVECLPSKGCEGTAVPEPPSINFGDEPLVRGVPIPVIELPTVTLRNVGEVELALTRIALEGSQLSAFAVAADLEPKDTLPGGQRGWLLRPGDGVNLPIRFTPLPGATAFLAELVIQSDDPTRPEVRVKLEGTLGANQPPRICANIVRVENPDVALVQYAWPPLPTPQLVYDFSATRDIQPRATVFLSALSDPLDTRACTSDPEDRRAGLVYAWSVAKVPAGVTAVSLRNPSSPTPDLTVVATGEYEVRLTVSDQQGNSSSTTIKFVTVLKKDLVVELSWGGDPAASSNIDLDLHLVRPSSVTDAADPWSGVFSFFEEGETSGDVNGFSDKFRRDNPGQLLNFEWGIPGVADNPKLNVDDVGGGPFIERISLDSPENDAACATQPCAYKVLVHYFGDKRVASSAPACFVQDGCIEGQQCDCGVGERCVASAAPSGARPSGPGTCHIPPKPVLRVFLKANPEPALVIGLPQEDLVVGAPCQMLYLADVVWPARNAGANEAPGVIRANAQLSRFGVRQPGSLGCSGNVPITTPEWYAQEPL